jgi:uncharacterized protein (TIGR02246 family)
LTAEVEALERDGWKALSGTEGAAFYADLMADDGLMVFPGLVMDKAESLRAIAGAPPWSTFELGDLRVIEATPDTAVVTYRATARRSGEKTYQALMTTVYVRRDGRWRIVLHQQSPSVAG